MTAVTPGIVKLHFAKVKLKAEKQKDSEENFTSFIFDFPLFISHFLLCFVARLGAVALEARAGQQGNVILEYSEEAVYCHSERTGRIYCLCHSEEVCRTDEESDIRKILRCAQNDNLFCLTESGCAKSPDR